MGICHCSICRRSVGSAGVAWATFARAAFAVEGEPAWHRSSEHARRGFCSACGTSLFFESSHDPGEIEVTVASMQDAAKVPPDHHGWTPSRLPWENVNDGLPRFREDGGSMAMDESSR